VSTSILAIILFLIGLCPAVLLAGNEPSTLDVFGWPLEELHSDKPPAWLGADPVLGRLACPPLIRLNLSTQKLEGLVLDRIESKALPNGHGEWSFGIKTGIYWWNGDAVTLAHVAKYIEDNLRALVAMKASSIWTIPSFSVAVVGDSIQVSWQTNPKFGPYILADSSLWRKLDGVETKDDLKFECAGGYIAHRIPEGFRLSPAEKYGPGRFTIRLLKQRDKEIDKGSPQWLEFISASHLESNPTDRVPDRPEPCKQRIGMPYLTVIEWNAVSRMVNTSERRKLIASFIPKGTLLRSGSGSFGDLISAPIPRHHPGYNDAIKVGKFALGGTIPKSGEGDGETPAKVVTFPSQKSNLNLGKLENSSGIVEKVLIDSFLASGLHLKFSPAKAGSREKFDGLLYTARLPGAEMNLLPTFHSKLNGSLHSDGPEGAALDRDLEGYLLQLSNGEFNSMKLKDIHQKLERLELMTILLQHSTCLVSSKNFAKTLGSIEINDPDWFRRLATKN
jgi:hypothetical protein